MSKHKGKIITALVILCLLAAAFWWGGSSPGLHGWNIASSDTPQDQDVKDTPSSQGDEELSETEENITATAEPTDGQAAADDTSQTDDTVDEDISAADGGTHLSAEDKLELAESLNGGVSSAGMEEGSAAYSAQQGMVIDESTGKDQYLTDPVPEGKPVPVEPQDATIGTIAYTCTLSVRCDTILDNIDWLDPEKVELVPEDGVIFPATEVTFYEGESVFNILQREMKRNQIHMEFENTPIYNSAYIEGINNLYEFDCGELSGWMYKVNNWFPNYGCSRYQLQDGDMVEWVYTCDLGVDVGGYYAVGGE